MDTVWTNHLRRIAFLSHLEALAIMHMVMGIIGVGEGTVGEDPPTTRDLNQKTEPS